jgi:peptidoglycan/xylan/chitin deacetylase (PgdA/CDA1 family)
MTFAQAEQARQAGSLPRRTVVVTFDDAYASTPLARPVLEALGWPATVFAVSGFAASGRPLSWAGIEQWAGGPHEKELEPLGWDGLRELRDAGWEVGSHTVSHPHLTTLSDYDLRDELTRSREVIAGEIGTCETIAYPYGDADRRVAAATAAAGYLAACTLPVAMRTDEQHLRPRVGLYSSDLGARLVLKTARPALALRRSRLLEAIARR